MAVAYCNSLQNFSALQNEINRLFARDVEDDNHMTAQWALRVDIQEEKDRVVILADLPGMEQKDIQIHVDNGRLTLSGERKLAGNPEQRKGYYRVERPYGFFSRSFQLPDTTDANNIQASFKNGVLTVTLPKTEKAKPRAIEVTFDA